MKETLHGRDDGGGGGEGGEGVCVISSTESTSVAGNYVCVLASEWPVVTIGRLMCSEATSQKEEGHVKSTFPSCVLALLLATVHSKVSRTPLVSFTFHPLVSPEDLFRMCLPRGGQAR